MSKKVANKSQAKEALKKTRWHEISGADCVKELGSNLQNGLTQAEVENRLNKYGHNELKKQQAESIWEKIKEQFEDLLVRLLLLAALISFVLSYFEDHQQEHAIPPWVEPSVIITILLLNAFVGIYQDLDAEKALEALKDLQSPTALALRDGKWNEHPSKELVPGDIVQISQGDKIPADLRMIELKTITMKIDQSILTGEATAVNKNPEVVAQQDAVILDKINIMFSGTLVNNGSAIGIVVETGMNTEIGNIQKEVEEAAEEEEDSPLKKRLNEFGELLSRIISVICLFVWAINIPNFSDPAYGGVFKGAVYYFKIAVALAVAAIPEGLPAVITTCLALGTRRMAKQKAIIRKLQSVETLGCTTIICSDKTGTLTTNEMCVESFFLIKGNDSSNIQTFKVQGSSYEPKGDIEGLKEYANAGKIPLNLKQFAQCLAMCNESKLMLDKEKGERVVRSGLPTEAALKVLNEKLGRYDTDINMKPFKENVEQYNTYISKEYEKVATLEFSRDRKSMSILVRGADGKNRMFIKGAPDYLLEKSKKCINQNGAIVDFNSAGKSLFTKQIKEYADKGLRTLAICYKEDCGILSDYNGPKHPAHKQLENVEGYAGLESDPILIGVVAVRDPPRPEVKSAIDKCLNAGISVIMITGDIKETAQSIASEIGILDGPSSFKARSFTGKEFTEMEEKKQLEVLGQVIDYPSGLAFSRTEPTHKRRLVQLLRQQNQIVAMTGDGVNDAPALRQADIGIAMGISGTEVAKEASKMVLSDDNFATIVAAVEEGRSIYSNMKGFIRYMISSNIGEVVSIFTSTMLSIPDGFNSMQLLWVNLVTDGLPATALSFNAADPDVMKKPPRKHDEPLISGWVFVRYMIIGTYVGLATVVVFVYWYCYYDWAGDGHPLIPFETLRNWGHCPEWKDFKVASFEKYDFSTNPCLYFTWGKQKASTLSLSVLVIIEMFNALNALSDETSIFKVGLFSNLYLIVAIAGSVLLHLMILYVPFFEQIFGTVPLNKNDWILVIALSAPVVLIDEVLKFFSRMRTNNDLAKRHHRKPKTE